MGAVRDSTTDEAILDEMVRRIVERFNPQRIILFGSRARGEATADSDYDLLIIAPSDEVAWKRTVPVYKALAGLGVGKDILWWTAEEATKWSAVRNHIVSVAQREGKVLYESAD